MSKQYKTVEEYSDLLKTLLNTDYVGYPTSTQLKMGVATLELLVDTLQKANIQNEN